MQIVEIIKFMEMKQEPFKYIGDTGGYIVSMANLQEIRDHVICWIKNREYFSDALAEELRSFEDVVVVCPFEIVGVKCIVTDYPKGVFFSILNNFFTKSFVHKISDRATILTDQIGDNVHIAQNCYIGEDVSIGANTIIYPNVVIDCPCTIGNDCIIHSGVVIGTDVQGFYFENDIPIKEMHYRGVSIGNNVEIGANATIARGLLTDTTICDNVKIWDLCAIGHNVYIGKNTLITGGSSVCGSARIGENSYLAPSSTVLNQVTVGNRVIVGVNSVAMRDIKDSVTIMGTPGKEFLPKTFNQKDSIK